MKTKRQLTNRILSLALALVLAVGMLPLSTLTALAEEKITYNLWVGGVQFTSDKLTIEDSNGGTATYDPTANTLTLNGYTYIGDGHWGDVYGYAYAAPIYYGGSTLLNLVLEGTNSVIQQSETVPYCSFGIYSSKGINISGTGSLVGKGGAANDQSYGIYAAGNVSITDGELCVTGNTTAINAYDVTINGKVNAEGGSYAFMVDNVTINGGVVTATGSKYGIYATLGSVTINGGIVTIKGTNIYGMSVGQNITISNDAVVEVSGGSHAQMCGNFIASSHFVIASRNADGANPAPYNVNDAFDYKYIKATPIYSVAFDANGGECEIEFSEITSDGKLTSLPTPTRENYNFIGWYTAATGGDKVDTDTVHTANTTLYAQWIGDIKNATIAITPKTGGYTGSAYTPTVTVTFDGSKLTENTDYTLSWDKADITNVDTYTVTVMGVGSFEGTATKTFGITQKEIGIAWGGTEFMSYTGQLVLPEVSAIGLADEDTCEVIVSVVETVDGAGIEPGRWTAKITGLSNGNYKLPENSNLLETDYSIYASQSAPAVVGVAETVKGKNDGYISGLTNEMEYATEPTGLNSAYTRITDTNMIFEPGTYYVRYAKKDYYYSSPYTEVTVAEGRELTVTLPSANEQIAYTIEADKATLPYKDPVRITIKPKEGCSKTEGFTVYNNGEDVTDSFNSATNTLILANVIKDVKITIADGSFIDTTDPTAEIKMKENKWTEFLNNLTFGLFFKETQEVTITADDVGSGVKSVQYFLSDSELDYNEVETKAVWETYNGTLKINPDNKYVIYVKVADNGGNTIYLNSNGIVLDATAPAITEIENGGTYYGDTTFKVTDSYFDGVTVDTNEVTLTDGAYTIVANNQEHTIIATDKSGNKTEYKITVYKNHTITYKVDGETFRTETVGHGKDAALPAVPNKEGYSGVWNADGKDITEDTTITAVYTANSYKVSFDTNGGKAIDPITVTFDVKYGTLPSSTVAGLKSGNKDWYLVDENGNVTETNIKKLTPVSTSRDHTLFIKRYVLSPSVSIKLTVPGGLSDDYPYYVPGASQRVLTATVSDANTELLNYSYQWYKDGALIEDATASVLTLNGNVADSGTYKVEVTATLKDGTGIVVTTSSATGSGEKKVNILRASNTLYYDANGGEGGPQSSYTGGTSLNVYKDEPTREHYDFIGWNTKADGSGDSYKAKDVYVFTEDGGNGGCKATLYAQWKLDEYTVTYKADGQTVSTEKVEYGKDAKLPAVPNKEGYSGVWDSDGKNITADTEINAIYTINKYTVTYKTDGEVVIALEVEHGENVAFPKVPAKDGYVGKWDRSNENITSDTVINAVYTEIDNVVPEKLKTDDKTDLEDTKKQLEDMLNDDDYTEDDKKAIQEAIDAINDAFEVIGNAEAVEELIDKLPDTIKKDDEAAIKVADDAYNALTDYEKSIVDEVAKKALDDAKAALAKLNKPVDTDSPQTGDNSNIALWIALLFISGSAVITLTVVDRKRKFAVDK